MTHSNCWFWDRSDIELDFDAIVQVALAFGWRPPRAGESRIGKHTMDDPFYAALRRALKLLDARKNGDVGETRIEQSAANQDTHRESALSRLGPAGIPMIQAYLDFANRKLEEESVSESTDSEIASKEFAAFFGSDWKPAIFTALLLKTALAFGWEPNVRETVSRLRWNDDDRAMIIFAKAMDGGRAHHSLVAAWQLAVDAVAAPARQRLKALATKLRGYGKCNDEEISARMSVLEALRLEAATVIPGSDVASMIQGILEAAVGSLENPLVPDNGGVK